METSFVVLYFITINAIIAGYTKNKLANKAGFFFCG